MIRVGINGFGRIGRAITRIISQKKGIKLCVINDLNNDLNNLAYLLKYDSVYGKFNKEIKTLGKDLVIDKKKIKVFSKKRIQDVKWKENKVDIVIEATGTNSNLIASRKILSKNLKKVIVTHSPKQNVDFTMILGVNEKSYNFKKHNVISSSICDASAIGPILYQIQKKWGIKNGYVTTLHSRLAYQNLLDGSVQSVSNPGHNWKDYSLGRNSFASLITKKTTAIEAVNRCIPKISQKISGLSFRVPTAIVCGSDISINLKKNSSIGEVKEFFENLSKKKSKILCYRIS